MSKSKAKKKTQKKYWGRGDFKVTSNAAAAREKKKTNQEKRKDKLDAIISLRGLYCFYCGEVMRRQDMTIEHLKSKSNGGTNSVYNLYLAHEWCNKEAGSKYTKDKTKMREIRTEESWHKCLKDS